MKNLIFSIALFLTVIITNAQSQIAAYPDNEGNWVVMVEKESNQKSEISFFDESGELLATRTLPKRAGAVKMRLVIEDHPDTVFKAVLSSKNGQELSCDLRKSAIQEGEIWIAQLK